MCIPTLIFSLICLHIPVLADLTVNSPYQFKLKPVSLKKPPTISAMFDLISSLITPGSSTSNPSPASTSEIQKSTLQAAGLAVYDVDDYLNKPKNHALMASTGKKSPGSVLFTPMSGFSSPQPVQLGGPKTSHHVTALYHLCQSRGLVPQFEIEANDNGGFGGCLRIGNETVVSREGWLSKKDAKEALAEKGSEIVKGMEWKGKGSGVDGDNKNWVGLLMRAQRTFFSRPQVLN